jgi:hypothetical protein|tara:strand:+ start:38 stop:262 length:225 start_codon:yes stop_codon:yes gene_type:complete
MADTIGLHRFDNGYNQLTVQQLDDGSLKSSVKFVMTTPATPGSADTLGVFVVNSKVGTQIVQQIGSGALKLNIM